MNRVVLGDTLATFSADGTQRLWDPAPEPRLRVVRRRRAPAPGPNVAVIPGKRAAAEGNLVVVEDLETGKNVVLRGHTGPVLSVHFDSEGTRLVTASEDRDARIWNAETGKLLRVLRGHFGPVSDAGFSPDGRWVVTAGPISGGLWRSDSGALHTYLRGHTARWTDARFVGERRIETAGEDNTVRAWNCDICGTLDELVELAKERLELTEGAEL